MDSWFILLYVMLGLIFLTYIGWMVITPLSLGINIKKRKNIEKHPSKTDLEFETPESKKQKRENIKYSILSYLENTNKPMTISQMREEIPQCAELSNQWISALVVQLEREGLVARVMIDYIAYFSASSRGK